MAKSRRCTEADISILLDTNSDTEESNECYTPSKDVDSNSPNTSNSGNIFENNKSLLLRNNALRKERASLRLRLRRSTEQSVYKIDTDSDNEEPMRLTENQTPRKGVRIIRLSKRCSEREYVSPKAQTPVVQKKHVNPDLKKPSPISKRAANAKKKTTRIDAANDDTSDTDCVCLEFIPKSASTRSNAEAKNTKRNRISSLEDVDSDILFKISETPSSRCITPKKKSKRNDEDDELSMSGKKTNSKRDTIRESSDITVGRRLQFEKNKGMSARSRKCESPIHGDKNEARTDEISIICEVTKDLSIKTRRSDRNVKNGTESPTVRNGSSTPKSRMSLKHSSLTPSLKKRIGVLSKPGTPLQEARSRLHVGAVPKSLPCREKEFNSIYSFLEREIKEHKGGCICISGVPGTGKTATVNEVVKCLKRSVEKGILDHFDFVEVNGMKLSEPRQVYVQILRQLSGKVLTWEQAYNALEKRFGNNAKRPMTLLLVDELDLLCTKRQEVIYKLLDWPAEPSACLIVITIANTMDLPERVLMSSKRVMSRLGVTRVTFKPYDHKQLQEIVVTRLKGINIFKSEAIEFIARKVSAASGDARRALNICRRAAEITEVRNGVKVSLEDVNRALSGIIGDSKVRAMKHCSKMERIFLQAIHYEVARIGVEEVCFKNVYKQFEYLCSFDGFQTPNISETLGICARLGSSRLLICENSRNESIHQRIRLNVSKDDIHYALQQIDLD